jgi:hypothetical protein
MTTTEHSTMDNSDFTQERVSKLCRIRDVRADFQLSPTEYVAILSIIDEYARIPSFLPDSWLECEDVLFETLVRVYKTEQQTGESVDSWISNRLRNDFMSGPDFTFDRFDRIAEHVERYSGLGCPTRTFRIYCAAHEEFGDRTVSPAFSVSSRMIMWATNGVPPPTSSPPGGGED